MVKNIIYSLSFVLLASVSSFAQPHFGKEQGPLNFRNKEMMVNPGYVGSIGETHRRLSIGAGWQWAGLVGAPKMQDLQLQMGLPNAGVGAWLHHESYGVTNVIQFSGAYSYSLKLADGHNLSLGLSLGALTVNNDFVTGLNDPNDPTFAQKSFRVWGINSGFGAMYYSDRYYVGLSVPQLLTNNWEEGVSESKLKNTFQFDQLQFYLVGGYVFQLSNDVNLIPNVLLQYSGSSSFGYEFMLRGDYKRRVAVGVGYGYDTALKAEAGVYIAKGINVGYRFEQSFGNTYKHLSGSHSLVLSVIWDRDKKAARLF